MESIQSGFVKRLLAKLTRITAAHRLSSLCKISLCLSFLAEGASYTVHLACWSLWITLWPPSTEQFMLEELAAPAAHKVKRDAHFWLFLSSEVHQNLQRNMNISLSSISHRRSNYESCPSGTKEELCYYQGCTQNSRFGMYLRFGVTVRFVFGTAGKTMKKITRSAAAHWP